MTREELILEINKVWQEETQDYALDKIVHMPSYPDFSTLKFKALHFADDIGGYATDFMRSKGIYIIVDYGNHQDIQLTIEEDTFNNPWYIGGTLNPNVSGNDFVYETEHLNDILGIGKESYSYLLTALKNSKITALLQTAIKKATSNALADLSEKLQSFSAPDVSVVVSEDSPHIVAIFTNHTTNQTFKQHLFVDHLNINDYYE